MATLDFLPATTYAPPTPGQAPRRRKSLNTIMEDDEESTRGSIIEVHRGRDISPRVADWLSPLSDHFPTPRGNHFMSAPIAYSNTASDVESSPSSAPWTRDSFTTEATEFDDLYDASSDEEDRHKRNIARRNTLRQSTRSNRSSVDSGLSRGSRVALQPLVIPSPVKQSSGDTWPGIATFKSMTSPVPPTPPPKVPMSPAIFSYLQSLEVPSSSAPPSLDGSLTSEQMAMISAPPTPDIGNDEDADGRGWGSGVQLQPAAMATLQALSGEDHDELFEQQTEQVIELTHLSQSPLREMQQSLPPLITNIHRNNSVILSPDGQRCMNDLTSLEIPSPGGFFSALSPRARHTWHLAGCTPDSAHPPSSTTAEHFYKTPWSSAPVERVVEIQDGSMSDGLPTARPSMFELNAGLGLGLSRPELHHESSEETIKALSPIEEDIVADEIISNYAPGYAEKLQFVADNTLDRTSMWLNAQSTYLSELINPVEDRDDEVALLKRAVSVRSHKEEEMTDSPPRKTVRFSEIISTSTGTDVACELPKIVRQESAYYRAFQQSISRARYHDTFIHRIPRFEALQSQRVTFPAVHRAQLLGKYQLSVVPMSAKRRLSANVARGDELAPENPEKLKRDKEFEATSQMAPATWNVMASKLLNGGRLIAAPVAERLARLSSMGPKLDGTPRARILDLGGQATCDWAWHCAAEYPNAKVYTVTTKSLRQLSNSNIRGPKNHRQIAVERLVKLPFADNQFDLISAREIHTVLKEQAENGQDEWDACLAECMRVLKPGGYLEFSVMDSDIVNAGPLGLAKSVEFGFNLKTLGYNPTPTKTWLGRLKNHGFEGIKRAWVFLPMGAKIEDKVINRNSSGEEVKLELEAMVQGSTENAAGIAGIVGAWAWEKWLLRCKVQTLGEKAGLESGLDNVQEIIQEGRACGAGWRTVSGWARKPL